MQNQLFSMASPVTLESLAAAVGAIQQKAPSYSGSSKAALGIFLCIALIGAAAGLFAVAILMGWTSPKINVKIKGNLSAQTINASNIVSTGTLDVSGASSFKSQLTAEDVTVSGTLDVSGTSSFKSQLTAAEIYASDISASGEVTANGQRLKSA